MKSREEILNMSKENKSHILNHFYKYNHPLDESLESFLKHELNALLLLTIEKPVELCRFLNTPFYSLEELINNPAYRQFVIKKKKGGDRQITAPTKKLKVIQKRLNYFLQ